MTLTRKDVAAEREWLVWALALSRQQRRRRGIRASKLQLIGRLQALDHWLKIQDTSGPDGNRGPIDTRARR